MDAVTLLLGTLVSVAAFRLLAAHFDAASAADAPVAPVTPTRVDLPHAGEPEAARSR